MTSVGKMIHTLIRRCKIRRTQQVQNAPISLTYLEKRKKKLPDNFPTDCNQPLLHITTTCLHATF